MHAEAFMEHKNVVVESLQVLFVCSYKLCDVLPGGELFVHLFHVVFCLDRFQTNALCGAVSFLHFPSPPMLFEGVGKQCHRMRCLKPAQTTPKTQDQKANSTTECIV